MMIKTMLKIVWYDYEKVYGVNQALFVLGIMTGIILYHLWT
jgi:hypothetical protein